MKPISGMGEGGAEATSLVAPPHFIAQACMCVCVGVGGWVGESSLRYGHLMDETSKRLIYNGPICIVRLVISLMPVSPEGNTFLCDCLPDIAADAGGFLASPPSCNIHDVMNATVSFALTRLSLIIKVIFYAR